MLAWAYSSIFPKNHESAWENLGYLHKLHGNFALLQRFGQHSAADPGRGTQSANRYCKTIVLLAIGSGKQFSDAGGTETKNDVFRRHPPINEFTVKINLGAVVLYPNLTLNDV